MCYAIVHEISGRNKCPGMKMEKEKMRTSTSGRYLGKAHGCDAIGAHVVELSSHVRGKNCPSL